MHSGKCGPDEELHHSEYQLWWSWIHRIIGNIGETNFLRIFNWFSTLAICSSRQPSFSRHAPRYRTWRSRIRAAFGPTSKPCTVLTPIGASLGRPSRIWPSAPNLRTKGWLGEAIWVGKTFNRSFVLVSVYQVWTAKSRNLFGPLRDYTTVPVGTVPEEYRRTRWTRRNWR